MNKSRFLQFVKSLNIDDSLFEAVQTGYEAIYEQGNSWGGYINGTSITPYSNPVGEPMGDWKKIMKQEGSPIGAVGGSGEQGVQTYRYSPSLPGPMRDIGEETREQWGETPKIPKIPFNQSNMVKKLIKKSQDNLPSATANALAPAVRDANATPNLGDGSGGPLNVGVSF
jgi:hypothetical protein